MSLALQPTHFIPIEVHEDWTVADDAATDVIASLESSFPGVFQFPASDDLNVTLVQVQAGATEKGLLTIDATTAAGTWSTAFATIPAVDSVVYLVDIY